MDVFEYLGGWASHAAHSLPNHQQNKMRSQEIQQNAVK
jgi:hypothetical protein